MLVSHIVCSQPTWWAHFKVRTWYPLRGWHIRLQIRLSNDLRSGQQFWHSLASRNASWPSCPMCLPFCPLSISLIRLSFNLWRDITQILKMNCCLSLLIYSLLLSHFLPHFLSLCLSLCHFLSFLPHTLFLLVKTESILESENRLSVSAHLCSLLDKGIQSPLLLLHLLAFLESFTQPFFSFSFFFSLGAVQKGFPYFWFWFPAWSQFFYFLWVRVEKGISQEEEDQWVTIYWNQSVKWQQTGNLLTFYLLFVCLALTFAILL